MASASAPYAGTKVLTIGGSRNTGYLASIRLLEKGATVTFLLRSGPATFEKDATIQKYVESGKARLIQGDALNKDDVTKAWEKAAEGEGWVRVGILLFTVGGTPKFDLLRGFTMSPPDLVTRTLINTLSTLPAAFTPPKIIMVSTTGITKASHSSLPAFLKPLYAYALREPHNDKAGAERVISYCAGWPYEDSNVKKDVLGKEEEWKEGLPKAGKLSSTVVLRPVIFTDGECKADKVTGKGKGKEPYRVQEGHIGGYTISRKDLAHFVVEGVLADWPQWEGKFVGIAY